MFGRIWLDLRLYCWQRYEALQQCNGNPFLRFHGKTRLFYIFTATCRSTTVQRDVFFRFRSNNAYANALRCYVIRTVPVLFWIITADNKSRKRCVPFRYICGFQVMIIILHKHFNCVFCENVEGSPFSNLMLPYCSPLYHQCYCTITLPSITVGVSAPLISIQSNRM